MSVMKRWFDEVWNQGREEVIDELLAPHAIVNGLVDAEGVAITSPEGFKSMHRVFRSALEGIHVEVEQYVTEGDISVARCVVTAKHVGEGFGKPPLGKPVRFTGMCMARIEGGQIVEAWNNFDFTRMLQQIE